MPISCIVRRSTDVPFADARDGSAERTPTATIAAPISAVVSQMLAELFTIVVISGLILSSFGCVAASLWVTHRQVINLDASLDQRCHLWNNQCFSAKSAHFAAYAGASERILWRVFSPCSPWPNPVLPAASGASRLSGRWQT